MYNIRLQAPKLARKCEIKHWYACGADGRKVGWSVYGHVIAEFFRMAMGCSQRTSNNISRKRVSIQMEQRELLTLFT